MNFARVLYTSNISWFNASLFRVESIVVSRTSNIWIGPITVLLYQLRNSWITCAIHRVSIRVAIRWWYTVPPASVAPVPSSCSMLLSIPFAWEKEWILSVWWNPCENRDPWWSKLQSVFPSTSPPLLIDLFLFHDFTDAVPVHMWMYCRQCARVTLPERVCWVVTNTLLHIFFLPILPAKLFTPASHDHTFSIMVLFLIYSSMSRFWPKLIIDSTLFHLFWSFISFLSHIISIISPNFSRFAPVYLFSFVSPPQYVNHMLRSRQ